MPNKSRVSKSTIEFLVGLLSLALTTCTYAAQDQLAPSQEADAITKQVEAGNGSNSNSGNSFANITQYPVGTRFTITEIHPASSLGLSTFSGKIATAVTCSNGNTEPGINLITSGSRQGWFDACLTLDGSTYEWFVYGFKFKLASTASTTTSTNTASSTSTSTGTGSTTTSNSPCSMVDSGFNIKVPCVDVLGTRVAGNLIAHPDRSSALGYYWTWKETGKASSSILASSCASVSSDISKITFPCGTYAGANYRLEMAIGKNMWDGSKYSPSLRMTNTTAIGTGSTGISSTKTPGASCGTGMVYDCDGTCMSSSTATSLMGTNYCTSRLNCSAFKFDGGDCVSSDTSTGTNGSLNTSSKCPPRDDRREKSCIAIKNYSTTKKTKCDFTKGSWCGKYSGLQCDLYATSGGGDASCNYWYRGVYTGPTASSSTGTSSCNDGTWISGVWIPSTGCNSTGISSGTSSKSCPGGTTPYGDIQVDSQCQAACTALDKGVPKATVDGTYCKILRGWERLGSMKASACGACQ